MIIMSLLISMIGPKLGANDYTHEFTKMKFHWRMLNDNPLGISNKIYWTTGNPLETTSGM